LPGRNTVLRTSGLVEDIGPKARVRLMTGDRLRIETPGGGGYGRAN
jgi:N-methylhydantoinase B/oxoprolinase/acetone carboxylase alpha subunit